MSDDREEFEQEQVSRDGEGRDFEQDAADIVYLVEGREEWISREVQGQRFDEAMARLGAEVAAHEPVRLPLALGDLEVVRAPITPEDAASLSGAEVSGGLRFGNRLRGMLVGLRMGMQYTNAELEDLAAAIDRDADALRCERIADEHEEGYRRALREKRTLIEEAVGRLRYSTDAVRFHLVESDTPHYRGEPARKDVLDAEPFLAELDRIFGERKEGHDTPWPLSDVVGKLCAAADHLLGFHNCDCHGYEEIKAAREAARRLEKGEA